MTARMPFQWRFFSSEGESSIVEMERGARVQRVDIAERESK
jgi:hypothetical protein